MEKISSIVSSTSQSKVDMSKERPVRAGAPSFGQPISAATKTFDKSKTEESVNAQFAAVDKEKVPSPDVQRHTGMIDKITLSFKGNSERKEPVVEQVIDLSEVESAPLDNEEQPQSLDIYA